MKHTRQTAVCIIAENLSVAADRRVWQEANALAEAGYSVSIICPKGRGCDRLLETLNGIEIYRHPSQFDRDAGTHFRVGLAAAAPQTWIRNVSGAPGRVGAL